MPGRGIEGGRGKGARGQRLGDPASMSEQGRSPAGDGDGNSERHSSGQLSNDAAQGAITRQTAIARAACSPVLRN